MSESGKMAIITDTFEFFQKAEQKQKHEKCASFTSRHSCYHPISTADREYLINHW